MSTAKKIMYILLAVLASAVMSLLAVWGFTENKVVLIVGGCLAAVFLVYFLALLFWNKKTGWMDEKTPRRRALSSERLLLDVYPKKNGIAADIYLPAHAEDTVAAIARITQNEGTNADMGAVSAVYIGSAVIKEKDAETLGNKILAVGGRGDGLPMLEAWKAKNDIVTY